MAKKCGNCSKDVRDSFNLCTDCWMEKKDEKSWLKEKMRNLTEKQEHKIRKIIDDERKRLKHSEKEKVYRRANPLGGEQKQYKLVNPQAPKFVNRWKEIKSNVEG